MVMKSENVGLDFSIEEQTQRLINPAATPQVTQDLSNNVVLTTTGVSPIWKSITRCANGSEGGRDSWQIIKQKH